MAPCVFPGNTQGVPKRFNRRSFQSLGSPEQRILPRSSNGISAKKASLPGHCFPQVSLVSLRPGGLPGCSLDCSPAHRQPDNRRGPRRRPPKQSIEPYTTPLLFWGCGRGPRGRSRQTKPAEARAVNIPVTPTTLAPPCRHSRSCHGEPGPRSSWVLPLPTSHTVLGRDESGRGTSPLQPFARGPGGPWLAVTPAPPPSRL